jgi:hypothetical protein
VITVRVLLQATARAQATRRKHDVKRDDMLDGIADLDDQEADSALLVRDVRRQLPLGVLVTTDGLPEAHRLLVTVQEVHARWALLDVRLEQGSPIGVELLVQVRHEEVDELAALHAPSFRK